MFLTNLNNPVTSVYLPLWVDSGEANWRVLILYIIYTKSSKFVENAALSVKK